jgi:hypothetical protein
MTQDGAEELQMPSRWAGAVLEELVRLTAELNCRLTRAELLPAIASIQAIMGRAHDLGEFCNRALDESLIEPEPPTADSGAYL